MARKNILASIMEVSEKSASVNTESTFQLDKRVADAPRQHKGALGAVTRSIDALAAKAAAANEIERKLTEGEVIVELNTDLVEDSFMTDRFAVDGEALGELVEAFRARGQDSPILVRPNPQKPGYYQVAFGHRRLRAARALGIPVRAVVKKLDDRDHIIAQGQENSARTDLSFIERAAFAKGMRDAGFDRETIMSALTVDKTTVSKMLSIFDRLPPDVFEVVKSAFSIGRDRWHELSSRFDDPTLVVSVRSLMEQPGFRRADADSRFTQIENLSTSSHEARGAKERKIVQVRNWLPGNGKVKAKVREDSKGFSLTLKAKNAVLFGQFIEANLERLYEEFESRQGSTTSGD